MLAAVGKQTGNGVFSRAAAALRAPPGGRPQTDDDQALAQLAALRQHDPSMSMARAAKFIALTMPHQQSLKATITRLVRKARAANKRVRT